MNVQANAVEVVDPVTVKAVFRMVLTAILSLLSVAPKGVTLIDTNLDTLQKLSDAGNLLASDVRSTALHNHELNVIEMSKLKTKAQRQAAAELAA
jgi:hypothetical protein